MPAHFLAFDVLQIEGQELLTEPYRAAPRDPGEPVHRAHPDAAWTLCPMTRDPAIAQEWLSSWTEVQGVEGIVIKGPDSGT